MRSHRTSGSAHRGFALVSAIAILVVLAVLGAYLGRMAAMSHLGSAQDIQGSRAYQAARAGIEWGFYQVLDPSNSLGLSLPGCPAATSLSVEGFTVAVSCTRYGPYTESTRSTAVFALVATATFGSSGTAGFVERQIKATVAKCRDSGGTSPAYACT